MDVLDPTQSPAHSATDPDNLLNADSITPTEPDGLEPLDPDTTVLTQLTQESLSATDEASRLLTKIAGLQLWADRLDEMGWRVSIESQYATEIILDLCATDTGLPAETVLPSLESYDNGTVGGHLRRYVTVLIEALLKLIERIKTLFSQFMNFLTSEVKGLRLTLVGVKAKMRYAKGGYSDANFVGYGRYASFVAIRNRPITTTSDLLKALTDVGELTHAAADSHLKAVSALGESLVAIAKSDGFPNPGMTESKLTDAFSALRDTALAKLCDRPLQTDTRFQQSGYDTYTSHPLIGNQSLFKTQPKSTSDLEDTFDVLSYELAQTQYRSNGSEYEGSEKPEFETMSFVEMRKTIEAVESLLGLVELAAQSGTKDRLVSTLGELRAVVERRAKAGEFGSECSDLLRGAVTAFSTQCTQPIQSLISYLITACKASIELINQSLKTYR